MSRVVQSSQIITSSISQDLHMAWTDISMSWHIKREKNQFSFGLGGLGPWSWSDGRVSRVEEVCEPIVKEEERNICYFKRINWGREEAKQYYFMAISLAKYVIVQVKIRKRSEKKRKCNLGVTWCIYTSVGTKPLQCTQPIQVTNVGHLSCLSLWKC